MSPVRARDTELDEIIVSTPAGTDGVKDGVIGNVECLKDEGDSNLLSSKGVLIYIPVTNPSIRAATSTNYELCNHMALPHDPKQGLDTGRNDRNAVRLPYVHWCRLVTQRPVVTKEAVKLSLVKTVYWIHETWHEGKTDKESER
jgi:hypothetical protein